MHVFVYLVLTWIRYFTRKIYTPHKRHTVYSTRENNLYKWPCSKVYIHLILNTVLLPEWSTARFYFCCFCFVIVVHESLVCPEQLNCLLFFRKILQLPQILWFSSIIWTLSNNDCMIVRSIVSHWGQLRDSYAAITEGSNALWCSRRKIHALRAGAWKPLNRMKMSTFFLFCLNVIFFSFSAALQRLQKILACFPEERNKLNVPWSSNSKSFHPPA